MGILGHPGWSRRVRNMCTDRYEPNYIGERLLGQRPERQGFDEIHIPCHAHILGSGVSLATGVCKTDIIGMKAYGGSLRAPGEMQKFRNAAQSFLWKKLLLVEAGSPDAISAAQPCAVAFKELVMSTLLPHSFADSIVYRTVLSMCAPGDWRNIDNFVFIVKQPGTSRDAVFKFVVEHLLSLLFQHVPFKYPDQKWTGSQKTLLDTCLPGVIHNLGVGVWYEYMILYHSDEVPAKHRIGAGLPAIVAPLLALGDAVPIVADPAAEVEEPPAAPAPGTGTHESWIERIGTTIANLVHINYKN